MLNIFQLIYIEFPNGNTYIAMLSEKKHEENDSNNFISNFNKKNLLLFNFLESYELNNLMHCCRYYSFLQPLIFKTAIVKCSRAAAHLDILKWARQNACPWNEKTYLSAVTNGNKELLTWLEENNCPT